MRILSRTLGIAALTAASISCGAAVRNGTTPAYLVIDSLQGQSGGPVSKTGSTLTSDVITNVTTPPCSQASPCPTVFGDSGQAIMHLALKDPGTVTNPSAISQFNAITIDRYHVEYTRADGRNTPGVDVPYAFDGVVTVTVSSASPVAVGFTLVRVVAKEEAPLVQLKNSNQFITSIARVTFYGHDQTGNQTSISGSIEINFGNFGDSQ